MYRAGEAGLDRVEFLLAPGPAEPLQPLRSVASGGESSRVMLALKAAPAVAPPLPPPPEGAAPPPLCGWHSAWRRVWGLAWDSAWHAWRLA